jgi:hypothetical protein
MAVVSTLAQHAAARLSKHWMESASSRLSSRAIELEWNSGGSAATSTSTHSLTHSGALFQSLWAGWRSTEAHA